MENDGYLFDSTYDDHGEVDDDDWDYDLMSEEDDDYDGDVIFTKDDIIAYVESKKASE